MTLIFVFLFSTGLCTALLFLLDPIARRTGLVDIPNARKIHDRAIPLTGGVALFVSSTLAILLSGLHTPFTLFLLAMSVSLLIAGLLDDFLDISASIRLVVQALGTLGLIYLTNTSLTSMGLLFNSNELVLGGFTSVLLTLFCVVGAVNAANMIDGLDGLLGGIIFITFSGLALLALASDQLPYFAYLLALLGSTLAFLMFNLGVFGRNRQLFLGDAGSLCIGFVAAWLMIRMSEPGVASMSVVSAGWLFGLPLLDSVSTMVSRLWNRRPLFGSAKDHMHHRLLAAGLTKRQSLYVMLALHSLFVAIGVLSNVLPGINAIPDYFLFFGFVLLVVAYHLAGQVVINRVARSRYPLAS